MASSNAFLQFLSMMVNQSPLLIVYVAGIIFALTRWRRHPRPALLVALGLAILLATNVAFVAVQVYVITTIAPGGTGSLARIFMIMGITSGLLHAAATGLLVFAAFTMRGSADTGFPIDLPTAGYAATAGQSVPPPLRG